MKQKKARRGMWTPAYLALLFGFTVYVLLDTFVIIRVYTPVTAQTQTAVSAEASAGSDSASAGSSALTESSGRNCTASQRTLTADSSGRTRRGRSSSSSGSASAEKQGTQDSAASPSEGASAAQAVATDTSYTDDNIRIELTTLRAYDTTIYAALVRADSTYLKTALAQNAYGKNVTAKTSVTAAQNGAILAVNGDYYGAQEKGYVIRGGVLYRSTPVSGREDLVIYADGSWEIITETQVSDAPRERRRQSPLLRSRSDRRWADRGHRLGRSGQGHGLQPPHGDRAPRGRKLPFRRLRRPHERERRTLPLRAGAGPPRPGRSHSLQSGRRRLLHYGPERDRCQQPDHRRFLHQRKECERHCLHRILT